VLVTGFAGGDVGRSARADLAAAGIRDALVPIEGTSRRTLAIVDEASGDATGFWEPGPEVSATEWAAFLHTMRELVPGVAAVVLSGSLPRGVPVDAYAALGAIAGGHQVPVVLDADGEALRRGLAARPAVVKPNAEELARVAPGLEPLAAARALRGAGADAVVASLGRDGVVASTVAGEWRASPAEAVRGNPTGAGDAAVAALTAGLVGEWSWPERLRHAVALSAATVQAPVAGSFDSEAYRVHLQQVRVEPLSAGEPSRAPTGR
jgi:tagatose 6-phosphate kinase